MARPSNCMSVLCTSLLIFLLSDAATAKEDITAGKPEDIFKLSLQELLQVKVTSASKFDEAVSDIPANVTIITRTEIENYGYTTFADIVRNIPGFYLLDNTESLFVGIRGVTGGGVQFLLNGIPHHPSLQKGIRSTDISQFNIPVASIDRIEVIRGPMSVNYGNNAFLGVINIITNDAGRQEGLASVSYGSRNTGEIFARYAKRLEGGFFAVNGAGYGSDGLSGDYADMLDADQLAALHPAAVSSMDGEVVHRHGSLDVSGGYRGFNAGFQYGKMDFGFYPTTVGLGGDNDIELTTVQGSLVYETGLSERTRLRATGIISTEEYRIPELSFLTPTTEGNQLQTSRRHELELNLIHKRDRLELLTGYRYRLVDDLVNDAFITLDPGDPPIEDSRHEIDDIINHDLFFNGSYRLSPTWRIVAGLRYQRLPEAYTMTTVEKSTGDAVRTETPIEDRDQFSGRIALLIQLAEKHQLKILAGSAAQDRDDFQFAEPEKITTVEINHVMTLDDFQLSSSLYFNDIEHIVQRSVVIDPDSSTTIDVSDNSGEWHTYGLEVIGEYRLSDAWRISGSMTLQKTEDQVSQADPGYSPELLAKLRTDYRTGAFTFGINVYYVASIQPGFKLVGDNGVETSYVTVNRIGDETDGYALLGANIRYDTDFGLYLNLNGKNLLGTEYRYPANEIATMTRGLIGEERIITATIGYEF